MPRIIAIGGRVIFLFVFLVNPSRKWYNKKKFENQSSVDPFTTVRKKE